MGLDEDLRRIADIAAAHGDDGETLAAVLASEPATGVRVYLCAYDRGGERRWLALDADGEPVERRATIRDAVSIAALCEVAVESAAGGDVAGLRAELVALRLRENPPGIDEAEEAALALERTLGVPPHLASPVYLDEIGGATRRLEHALGGDGVSPFAAAMQAAFGVAEALAAEVEANYKRELRS